MKCGTYAAYGCVDSSGEQCSYKQRCFLGGDLACINSVMHAGTEASRREVLSAALLNHVRLMWQRVCDRVSPKLIVWSQRVEYEARVGQQVFPPLLLDTERVRKH
jgi:hypothetical protein